MARSLTGMAAAMTFPWSFFIDGANPLAASVATMQ
jgi:hypothetical protein